MRERKAMTDREVHKDCVCLKERRKHEKGEKRLRNTVREIEKDSERNRERIGEGEI